jgi:hypothetical protein
LIHRCDDVLLSDCVLTSLAKLLFRPRNSIAERMLLWYRHKGKAIEDRIDERSDVFQLI